MGFAENYLRAKQLRQAEDLRARAIAKEDKLEKEDLDRKKFGGAFSNMMLEEYSFQGQFKATPFGLEFENIPIIQALFSSHGEFAFNVLKRNS